jgi:hypothetical protein
MWLIIGWLAGRGTVGFGGLAGERERVNPDDNPEAFGLPVY